MPIGTAFSVSAPSNPGLSTYRLRPAACLRRILSGTATAIAASVGGHLIQPPPTCLNLVPTYGQLGYGTPQACVRSHVKSTIWPNAYELPTSKYLTCLAGEAECEMLLCKRINGIDDIARFLLTVSPDQGYRERANRDRAWALDHGDRAPRSRRRGIHVQANMSVSFARQYRRTGQRGISSFK